MRKLAGALPLLLPLAAEAVNEPRANVSVRTKAARASNDERCGRVHISILSFAYAEFAQWSDALSANNHCILPFV